jgi:hypothetical protein
LLTDGWPTSGFVWDHTMRMVNSRQWGRHAKTSFEQREDSMRKSLSMLMISSLALAGIVFSASPAAAVTANCSKWKIAGQGGATCTGSGGQWRLWLDCPSGFDYRSNWMTLSSTPTSASGSCHPYQPLSVNIETRS